MTDLSQNVATEANRLRWERDRYRTALERILTEARSEVIKAVAREALSVANAEGRPW